MNIKLQFNEDNGFVGFKSNIAFVESLSLSKQSISDNARHKKQHELNMQEKGEQYQLNCREFNFDVSVYYDSVGCFKQILTNIVGVDWKVPSTYWTRNEFHDISFEHSGYCSISKLLVVLPQFVKYNDLYYQRKFLINDIIQVEVETITPFDDIVFRRKKNVDVNSLKTLRLPDGIIRILNVFSNRITIDILDVYHNEHDYKFLIINSQSFGDMFYTFDVNKYKNNDNLTVRYK